MHSLPGPQLDNVSPSGFVYHQCARFIRRNKFHHIGGKSGGSDQDKSEEERDFHWMQWGRYCFGPGKIGCGKMKNFAAHFQNALKNLSYRSGSALCRVHGRQKEIARKMGVSEEVLPNWLNGSRSRHWRVFSRFAIFSKSKSNLKSGTEGAGGP